MIIAYIHGFLSGPNAIKATILKNYLYPLTQYQFVAPSFPDTPAEAFDSLISYFDKLKERSDDICLVGSSMGGFFATALQCRFGFKVALLNPCVHPQDYFSNLIGNHYNELTDTHFELKPQMLDFLLCLDNKNRSYIKDKTFVLLQEGDEVLDYKKAVDFYDGCKISISAGGCHTFENFVNVIPDILEFFN